VGPVISGLSPVSLPRIARAEDLVVGAGRVAKDAMKDTVWETQSWKPGLWWRYIWMMLDENI